MHISVMNRSELERTQRIDGEYYQNKYLDIEKAIFGSNSFQPVTKICQVSDGNHMSIARYFNSEQGVPYFRGQDLTDFFLENVTPQLIPENIYNAPLMKRSHFHQGDVLLSIVGTIGNLSLVTENIHKSTGSCKIAILRPQSISSEYLAAFLMSRYGHEQIKRNIRGAVQTGLILEDFSQIYIVIASDSFQKEIVDIIKKALEKNNSSRECFSIANQLTLSELNLSNWHFKHSLTFAKNYSDTKTAGRLDAEYFQPKYEEIVKAIQNYPGGWDEFRDIAYLKDSNYIPKDSQRHKYIELANIEENGEITGCMIEEGRDLPTRARRIVSTGDVIVSSIEGSLSSIALIQKEYDKSLCSTGFHVINSNVINSETLLVLLKSKLGQMQLKKGCSGTILTAINKDEINKIVLPKVDNEIQLQIQQKVTASFNLRKQSKHLLECAKRAVEIAIEQDEKSAMKWLEQETEAIDAGL